LDKQNRMNVSKLMVTAVLVSAAAGTLAGLGACTLAQPDKKEDAKQPAAPTSAEQQKMMDDWMASMKPGPAHEAMKKSVGKWDCAVKVFAGGPGAPAQESKGKATIRMMLGDKYQVQEFEGEMMGMPMSGFGMTGFDNTRKQYVGTWADTFGTSISYMTGSKSPDGKIITMFGTMDEPMTGEMGKTVKYVTRFIDDNTFKFEAWEVMYGSDFIAFEITYTRAK
jgi:hypothetical protein